jgi:hypothetical protein
MNSFWTLSAYAVMGSLLAVTNPAYAFKLTSFSPTDFSDDSAGISEFTIEDFEDTNLIPGLSVEWSGPQIGPFTTLPSVINNADFWFTPNNAWDGENLVGNFEKVFSSALADTTTFNFATNPTSVGVGISNYQYSDAVLLINGTFFSGLSAFNPVLGLGKNIYLRIDSENGEAINSISIDGQVGDFLGFDRLAVGSTRNTQSVPAPLPILGVVAAFRISRRMRHRINSAKQLRITNLARPRTSGSNSPQHIPYP